LVPEAIAAKMAGIPFVGWGFAANRAGPPEQTDHAHVLKAGQICFPQLCELVRRVLERKFCNPKNIRRNS